MLAFFHFHKCAGSTIVDAAAKSGLKLPPQHRNGNPLNDYGLRIEWSKIDESECEEILCRFRDQGIDLVAFEHDIPPWAVLDRVAGLRFLTVLREPQSRAFSNYKYSLGRQLKKGKRVRPELVRLAEMKGDPLSIVLPKAQGSEAKFRPLDFQDWNSLDGRFRADNFFVRWLCREPSNVHLDDSHLEFAIDKLTGFERVLILERDEISSDLETLGFKKRAFRKRKKSTARYPDVLTVGGINFDVKTFPRSADFVVKNSLDYSLYSYFMSNRV